MRQHHAGSRIESQVGNLEVHKDVIGGVLPEGSIIDAGGVVDEDFRDAYLGDGGFEGGGQGGMVGHVGGVGAYGCGRGGGSDEGCITREIGRRAGEEGDVIEAVGSE